MYCLLWKVKFLCFLQYLTYSKVVYFTVLILLFYRIHPSRMIHPVIIITTPMLKRFFLLDSAKFMVLYLKNPFWILPIMINKFYKGPRVSFVHASGKRNFVIASNISQPNTKSMNYKTSVNEFEAKKIRSVSTLYFTSVHV